MAFSLFGVVLTMVYGSLAREAVHLAEDVIIERWLAGETARALAWQAGGDVPLVPFPVSTTQIETLPPSLRTQAAALGARPGRPPSPS